MNDVFFALFGTAIGYLAGLIPGIGNVVVLLLMWPLLFDATLFQMLLFYLAMISACQFSGSVIATVFGVPGESSSMPAVIEGNRMFHRGEGNFAISNAAMGSVIGSIISLSVVFFLLPSAVEFIKSFYNNNVQILILSFSVFCAIALLGTSIIKNTFVFSLGFMLSMIGFNHVPFGLFMQNYLPYESFPSLKNGLPFFPIIVSLYVFPVLLNTLSQMTNVRKHKKYVDNVSYIIHIKKFYNNIWSAFRGSVFGSIIGLVPHVGTSISSNLSYAFEKRIGVRRNSYNNKGDLKSLVAAETANNSTGFTSMMPLMLLGIPITASEAILLSLIEANSIQIDYTTTAEVGMFGLLALYFIFVNVVCFTLSWPAVFYVNYLKKISLDYLLIITAVILFCIVYYLGHINYSESYYMMVLLLLLPIGYLLKKSEPLVLIIGFVLQDKILSSISVFYQINFI